MGSDLESNKRGLEISGSHGRTTVCAALGMHPRALKDRFQVDSVIAFMEANIHQAVAVGEVGLDFWLKHARKDASSQEFQKQVFAMFLDLAKQRDKPVSIHARRAWEAALDMVLQKGVPRAVFHWYSGPLNTLDRLLRSGHFISATPAAAYSEKHQAAVSRAPLEQLLLETDAPVAYNQRESEPAHIAHTLQAVARLKQMGPEEVEDVTTRNALSLFDLERSLE
jgi:TatD DNase family protein